MDGSTICAVATAPGRGGIAVIRVSGKEAIEVVGRVFRPGLAERPSHGAVLGRLVGTDGTLLDECVAVPFRGPRSYTGEDTVELSVHGSPYIQEEAVRALLGAGCRLAGPGEFTLRAFMHGRLDLAQAEAVGDLIAAEHAGAHRLALEHLRGGFSREIRGLRERLIGFAGLLELELDFAEEDVAFADRAAFDALLAELLTAIAALTDSFATGNALRDGVPVAIIGAPNRGKSTLLNALLGDDRAIVSDVAGTTRDTIEDTCILGGIKFRFIDTAGLRETADAVEAEGIRRALNKAATASIVLHLLDAASDPSPLAPPRSPSSPGSHVPPGTPVPPGTHVPPSSPGSPSPDLVLAPSATVLRVWNKVDLATPPDPASPSVLHLSARSGLGLSTLRDRLIEIASAADTPAPSLIVTNLRHYEALTATADALRGVRAGLASGLPTDLCASSLRQALYHLGSITGEIDPEDILDHIFANFCIGK